MFSSEELEAGSVYTREALRQRFQITDATINTGIFQPKNHDSVWLFVTEKKSTDRTQYSDLLDGDTLHWEGQMAGRKDKIIIEHARRGLELLVFYRKSRDEYPGAGFRYEGRFQYQSHGSGQPTRFLLSRLQH